MGQPRHIADWYFPAPYGVYRTQDGEIAISLADMKVLGELGYLAPEIERLATAGTIGPPEDGEDEYA